MSQFEQDLETLRSWIQPIGTRAKHSGCPECGMIFEEGKAYGYVCPNIKCPTQPKTT